MLKFNIFYMAVLLLISILIFGCENDDNATSLRIDVSQTHNDINITWHPVYDEGDYLIEISAYENFYDNLYEFTTDDEVFSWKNAANFTGNYFVRVTARNSGENNEEFSEIVDFKVLQVLEIPCEISIIRGADSYNFSWHYVQSAQGYKVQISSDSLFQTKIINESINACNYSWNLTNVNDGKYYFRVSADGKDQYISSYYTKGYSCDLSEDIISNKLSTPGVMTVTQFVDDVYISWPRVGYANNYFVQVATDSAFTQDLVELVALYNTHLWRYQFYTPDIYYFRVKAVGRSPYIDSDYSDITRFEYTEYSPVVLSGTIDEDLHLTAGNEYLLSGKVFVGDENDPGHSTTLTIDPGTIIRGESDSDAMLIITRGGRIIAEGTIDNPIIFTSEKFLPSHVPDPWKGIVINGWADQNDGIETNGVESSGLYGGNDNMDNSGIMRYCRIEYAGRQHYSSNKSNALTLQGVGSGTTIEYIQIHQSVSGGIGIFGGTVNARYLYVSGAYESYFRLDNGWQGKGQFWCCQYWSYYYDNSYGIESINSTLNPDYLPRTSPTIYNFTLFGHKNFRSPDPATGIYLHEGTSVNLYNGIIANFNTAGINIDDDATFTNARNNPDQFEIDYCIFADNRNEFLDEEDDYFNIEEFMMNEMQNNQTVPAHSSVLVNADDFHHPDYTPIGVASELSNCQIPVDGFLESTNYYGAFDPDGSCWIEGWTTSEQYFN